MGLKSQFGGSLQERINAEQIGTVSGMSGHHGDMAIAPPGQIVGGDPAVFPIVRLHVVSWVILIPARHEPHGRPSAELLHGLSGGLLALDDDAVEFGHSRRPGNLVSRIGEQHLELDPATRLAFQQLGNVVMKPVEVGVTDLGAHKPRAQQQRFAFPGLGASSPLQRSRSISMQLHHRANAGEAVGCDNFRLIDGPRDGRRRHARLLGYFRKEHTRCMVIRGIKRANVTK